MATVMENLFEKGLGADVLLRVKNDERELKAHRFFLVEVSPYFKTMLSVKPDSGTLVVSGQMSFDTLRLLIKHMYTGLLDDVTSVEQVKDLLKAAIFFDWDIRMEMTMVIKRIQTVSNICEIANVVVGLNVWTSVVIYSTVYEFLLKNFNSIRAEKTYLGLAFRSLKYILRHDLQIDSEMALFKAIVLWIQHDFPGRHRHFPELLEGLSYSPVTTIDFLMENMLPWCSCEQSKRHLIYMLALKCGHKDKGPVDITAREYFP